MKILSFIFALYFFGLSVKTCEDVFSGVDNCQTETCIHFEAGHDDDHPVDTCSPLCMCNCCGGVAIVKELGHNIKFNFSTSKAALHSEKFLPEVFYSIWQPPKV